MGSMNSTVIVLPVILGCGVAVVMGWAISHRFIRPEESKEVPQDVVAQQAQYMREVRLRHHDDLAMSMGGRRVLE
ncbi:hypothetical protein LTR17_012496 [Elasticomyces elasticus]|nr:hypothetical protein LTR17_012496 [Elasticomyces elasticus]